MNSVQTINPIPAVEADDYKEQIAVVELASDKFMSFLDLMTEAKLILNTMSSGGTAVSHSDVFMSKLDKLHRADPNALAAVMTAFGLNAFDLVNENDPISFPLALARRASKFDAIKGQPQILFAIVSDYLNHLPTISSSVKDNQDELANLEVIQEVILSIGNGINVLSLMEQRVEMILASDDVDKIDGVSLVRQINLLEREDLLKRFCEKSPEKAISAALVLELNESAIDLYKRLDESQRFSLKGNVLGKLAVICIETGNVDLGLKIERSLPIDASDIIVSIYEAYLKSGIDPIKFYEGLNDVRESCFLRASFKIKPDLADRLIKINRYNYSRELSFKAYIAGLEQQTPAKRRSSVFGLVAELSSGRSLDLNFNNLVSLGSCVNQYDLKYHINKTSIEAISKLNPKNISVVAFKGLLQNLISTPRLIDDCENLVKYYEERYRGVEGRANATFLIDVYGSLAQIYYKLGRTELSADYVSRAEHLVTDPNRSGLSSLCKCYVGVGRMRDAIDLSNRLIPDETRELGVVADTMAIIERSGKLTQAEVVLFNNALKGIYLNLKGCESSWIPGRDIWKELSPFDLDFVLEKKLENPTLNAGDISYLSRLYAEAHRDFEFISTCMPFIKGESGAVDFINLVNGDMRSPLLLAYLVAYEKSETEIKFMLNNLDLSESELLSFMDLSYSNGYCAICLASIDCLMKKGIEIPSRYLDLVRITEIYDELTRGHFDDMLATNYVFGNLTSITPDMYKAANLKPSINFLKALVGTSKGAALDGYLDLFNREERIAIKEQLKFGNKEDLVKYWGRYLTSEEIEKIKSLDINFSKLTEAWKTSHPGNHIEIVRRNLISIVELEKQRPGIVKTLHEMFGINCFARYPSALLVKQYDERLSNKPYGVFAIAISDSIKGAFNNQTFTEMMTNLHNSLTSHGLGVRIVEARNKFDYAKRFISLDRLYGERRTNRMSLRRDGADKGTKISFVVNVAHGSKSADALVWGDSAHDRTYVHDIRSKASLRLSKCFKDGCVIGNYACSAGIGVAEAQSFAVQGSIVSGAPRILTISGDKIEAEFGDDGKLKMFKIVNDSIPEDDTNRVFLGEKL